MYHVDPNYSCLSQVLPPELPIHQSKMDVANLQGTYFVTLLQYFLN